MNTRKLALLMLPTLALGLTLGYTQPSQAEEVSVVCQVEDNVSSIVASSEGKEVTLLRFLPQYFESEEQAIAACQQTAQTLQASYLKGQAAYLTSGNLEAQPVVCAVTGRESDCSSYDAQFLFNLKSDVDSPVLALYDMLGEGFQQPMNTERTVTRIYTSIAPSWWPWQ